MGTYSRVGLQGSQPVETHWVRIPGPAVIRGKGLHNMSGITPANSANSQAGGARAQSQPLTSRDLARRAGVSQSTVSRVLAGSPHVRAETRERVLKVLEEANYTPNALARAMKTGRTYTVGVFMMRVKSPFHAALLDTICRALSDSGLHMILWNLEHDTDEAAAQVAQRNLVDGCIFTSALSDSKAERAAVRSGIPSVLVHRELDDVACDQVIGDNRSGGAQVARYLVGAGHTRIGLVTTTGMNASTICDREEGFRAALAACGVDLPPDLIVRGASEHHEGHAAVRQLMNSDTPPSAIFAVTDLLACGVLDGARSIGVRVPDDLWVVGFDNIDMAAWESFDLSTVNQPTEDIVATGIELLKRRIADPSVEPERVTLPCSLVVRGSTGNTPA